MTLIHPNSIVVLDFGGQYTHLIANRIRKLGAFSEICEPEIATKELKQAAGIILSGGPQSVYDPESPQADKAILDLGIPILGICYGHQWITHVLGGSVKSGETKEYGYCEVDVTNHPGRLFWNIHDRFTVWMSHGDEVGKMPDGFRRSATSHDCKTAAMAHDNKQIYGLQFHPEVTHTEYGSRILKNFVDLCEYQKWSTNDMLPELKKKIADDVGERNVFILVSGGVDSSVAFSLLNDILGEERVYGLLIDHGLLRKNEARNIADCFEEYKFHNLHVEDASNLFFKRLNGISNPEEKRKIIGNTFLDVQRNVAKRLGIGGKNWMLGQGTIYPDTIETGGTKHSDTIKTHHNRIDAIQNMIEKGDVIEPLKDLYKDEVRQVGQSLGLPHHLVWRHPFPGPGLGVRIICANKPETVENMPKVQSDLYEFNILPVKSVGVQGDQRTYRHPIAIFLKRQVHEIQPILGLATALPNTHPEINRVLFCTSHNSPPNFVFTPTFITRDTADLLREADHIVKTGIYEHGLYDHIWQFPVVLLPIGTGKNGRSIVLRPVDSQEAMTANATRLETGFLREMTEKIMDIDGIDAVFYDVTNKPPATIEWE